VPGQRTTIVPIKKRNITPQMPVEPRLDQQMPVDPRLDLNF
jgi:hypothetical protein